jgi:NTE family protein
MKIRKSRLIRLISMLVLIYSTEQPMSALILSGGGARGFAHVGVLRALEEIGFYPDLIIGTSMGAIVGGLYAAGNRTEDIENYIRQTPWNRLFSPNPYREIEFVSQKIMELPELFTLKFDDDFNIIFPSNLLPTQKLQERIFQVMCYPEYATGGDFDSLMIPLRVLATDIKTGQSIVLKKGSLSKAITASSSFPIILAPVPLDTFMLVDGGLTNNVPCDIAVEMGADFIIAVDVTSKITEIPENMDLISYFNQAMNTMAYLTDTRNLYLADILIHPEMEEYTSADFKEIDSLINRGYRATQPFLDEIRAYSDSSKWDADYLPQAVSRLNNSYIRTIKIRGNRKTRPYVIRRELLMQENDRWNSAYAQRSLKNLFSTGLFRSVFISFGEQSRDSTDIIIEVEEDENTLFSFGTRYDSERKASAFIAANNRNLFGLGIDNQFSLIVSDLHRKIAWNARTTRIFTTTFTGYLSLYHLFESVPLYEVGKRIGYGEYYRTGFEFNAGVQVRRVGLSSIGFKLLNTVTLANDEYNLYQIKADEYNSASVQFRILVDNTNDPDIPTRGRNNSVLYEHVISEDDLKQFDRISVNSTVYETFDDKHTFSTHINFGYLSKALSHFERFRLGGVHSLPGYHQDEFWGPIYLALGLGYRIPLTSGSYLQFQGMTGNVWDSFAEFNWQDMKIGARAGIMVPTPIGPISLDYGSNFADRSILYLSIGHYF